MDRGRGGPPRGFGGPPRGRGGPPRGRGGPPRGRGGGGFKKSEPDAPRVNSEVQVFVENLPRDIKIPEVCQFFSTVGKIKVGHYRSPCNLDLIFGACLVPLTDHEIFWK